MEEANKPPNRNTMEIKTDRDVYSPGDLVKGEVVLHLDQETNYTSIRLQVLGVESACFEPITAFVRVDEEGQYEHGRHVILDETQTLAEWSIVPRPGCYDIPFKFVLPESLPNSFASGDGTYRASIEYQVISSAERPGLHLSRLLSCKKFRVQRMGSGIARPAKGCVQKQTSLLCCLPSKPMSIEASLQNAACSPGQVATLDLELQSSAGYPHLEVRIIRNISLRSGRTCGGSYFADCSKSIEEVCYSKSLPRPLPATRQRQLIEVPFWPTLPLETDGTAVRCQYHIEVILSSGMLGQHAKVCLPVSVCAEPPMEGLPVSNGGSLMLAPEMVSLIMDSPVTVRSRSPRSDFDEGEPSDEQWINNPLLSKRNQ